MQNYKIKFCLIFLTTLLVFSSCTKKTTSVPNDTSTPDTSTPDIFFDVSFETNGGNNINSINVKSGGKITKPENPILEGNAFIGWYKEADFINIFNFDNETITQNTIIYAKWEKLFISIWRTGNNNESITLPLVQNGVYDFNVDWGDGQNSNITNYNSTDKTHTYTNAGEYTVTITGIIEGFAFGIGSNGHTNNGTPDKIIDIKHWGILKLGNNGYYFSNCRNLTTITASDVLNLSGTTFLRGMFQNATKLISINNIDKWDVSQITDMSDLFINAHYFNQYIGSWNTSNVTNMGGMFIYAYSFNQDISRWDVSNVTNMWHMFNSAFVFNQNIGNWNTTNVVEMSYMFFRANSFNKDLSNWNTANITNMSYMFSRANSFNQDLSRWDVSNVRRYDSFDIDARAWEASKKPKFK